MDSRRSPICHPIRLAVSRDGEETIEEIELHAGCSFRFALNEEQRRFLVESLSAPTETPVVLTIRL